MEWKKRNAQLEQEVQNLKNKVTRLETYNQTFENKIKDLTDEIVNARHKIAQLEAQNDEAQRNIEAQQKEVRIRLRFLNFCISSNLITLCAFVYLISKQRISPHKFTIAGWSTILTAPSLSLLKKPKLLYSFRVNGITISMPFFSPTAFGCLQEDS